jgi:hypothetical protein
MLEPRSTGRVLGSGAFATGLGLHLFGIQVLFFLMWCLMWFMVQGMEASDRVGLWTLGTLGTAGTAGIMQAVYMVPAYVVAV